MTKSERLASTGKSFEKISESESSQSESEDDSTSSSSSDRSSSLVITDNESHCNDDENDDSLDETTFKNTDTNAEVFPKGNSIDCTRSTGIDKTCQTLAESREDRQILDSGIGSWVSISDGSSVEIDDVASKRRRLVSMASGSLEDNVFTNSDK